LELTQKPAIAAVSTPVGEGALAVVRISGENAVAVAEACFKGPARISDAPTHTVHYGYIVDPVSGAMIDEVMAAVFRTPRSFTGEDSVEITCHGGVLVTQQVFETVLKAGARAAEPGEFTQRAFMNGKMDLSQAEAVADLIHAQSESAVQAARIQLQGKLGGAVAEFRQQLIDATAMIELELDFSEEDVEFANKEQLVALLEALQEQITSLLKTYESGRLVKDGIRTAIIGRPNAGKSTLLNALVGHERAIVTELAGTTRDTIEVDWSHGGLLFRLIDTAGLRETEDIVEAEGVRRSQQALASADLILYLKDASQPLSEEEMESIQILQKVAPSNAPFLKVLTQLDKVVADRSETGQIVAQQSGTEKSPQIATDWHLQISALTGHSLEELKDRMLTEALTGGKIDTESLMVTSSRHRDALQKTGQFIENALKGLEANLPGDLLAIDLRGALHQLGLITGAITTEDVLDSIFSRFCIGK
jgi:tRNA modification GTPase